VAEKISQLQLCFKWPDRGFQVDTFRIASIERDEWEAVLTYVAEQPGDFPILQEHIGSALPWEIRRENLSQLRRECDRLIDYDRIAEPEMGALLTLSMVVSQALDQREAMLSIEFWDDAYFDSQVFLAPGVDLLADLIALNEDQNV
jgi:hypothetical protein